MVWAIRVMNFTLLPRSERGVADPAGAASPTQTRSGNRGGCCRLWKGLEHAMSTARIDIPKEKIAEFCRQRKIKEFSLFGSALREDFGPKSDVDVLN